MRSLRVTLRLGGQLVDLGTCDLRPAMDADGAPRLMVTVESSALASHLERSFRGLAHQAVDRGVAAATDALGDLVASALAEFRRR